VSLKLIPAVMSGGSGTRLWPLSTDDAPKQFHALGSDQTLIQDSIERLVAVPGLQPMDPILICNRRHADVVDRQLAQMGRTAAAVVLEPFGRNTAAVAAIAALLGRETDPDALVLLMPADHVIADTQAFSATIARASPVARTHIVVFGVEPTAPETGYGYIESGETIDGAVRRVVRFAEKPDMETAKAYLAGRRHLWNAGIFLFSPAVLLGEMERFAPEVLEASRQSLGKARRAGSVVDLDETAFAACPSISIDYALMEKTDRAAVAPIGADWADVGSWSELWRLGPHDERDNFVHGDALLIDTDDTLVWADSKTVGVIGVKDLIIVQTEEAVIVLPKSRAQDVKLLVEQVKARRAK
jgi:mannose-1-phosphate guanylyltransferase/mannose-6-phosphate isomerase